MKELNCTNHVKEKIIGKTSFVPNLHGVYVFGRGEGMDV
jgi:hypothetical protein